MQHISGAPFQDEAIVESIYITEFLWSFHYIILGRKVFFAQRLSLAVAAIIIQKPSSVIVEEGENVTLLCKASGRPTPTVTWVRAFIGHLPKGKTTLLHGKLTIQNVAKADSGTYACSAKNFLGKDSAFALITVTDRLKFTQTPPLKVSTEKKSNLMLNCAARGTMVIIWKRAGQCLPQNHVVYRNGTLLLRNLSPKDAGSYTCVAKNAYRSIEARTVVKVLGKYRNLSENTSWHFLWFYALKVYYHQLT